MTTSPRDIKKLFGKSGNQCSFPKCLQVMIDDNGTVIGEMAHIKGKRKGGARHVGNQSKQERDAYENLILLCPNHHKVIDDDPEAYSVIRLVNMKNDHENSQKEMEYEINKDQLNLIVQGSIIVSKGQMGGQVAHSITNIGYLPRRISQNSAEMLLTSLSAFPPNTIKLTSIMGDGDSLNLMSGFKSIFQAAQWVISGESQAVFAKPINGIQIKTPKNLEKLARVIGNWLMQNAFKTEAFWSKGDELELIIGYNL